MTYDEAIRIGLDPSQAKRAHQIHIDQSAHQLQAGDVFMVAGHVPVGIPTREDGYINLMIALRTFKVVANRGHYLEATMDHETGLHAIQYDAVIDCTHQKP